MVELVIEIPDVVFSLLVADPVPFGIMEFSFLEFGVFGGDSDEDTPTEQRLQLPEVVYEW